MSVADAMDTLFTFQYVSINTEEEENPGKEYIPLHSNMFLLIHQT